MKSFASLAAVAASFVCVAPLFAQELLLNYNFDEAASGDVPVIDHGTAEPRVDGRFFNGATRTNNTPGGASIGALDVTQGGHILANMGHPDIPSLDGKLDNLTQATVTVWLNLQADPQEHDRVFSTGPNGVGLRIMPPVTIDGVDPGPMSASNFSLGLDTADGAGPSYHNFDADDKWLFIAVTFDGTAFEDLLKFYAGDAETESALLSATAPLIWDVSTVLNAHLMIGRHSTANNRNIEGYVDDLRIYRGVLTEEQIEEVRLANLVPSEPPPEKELLVRYNFDEAAGGNEPALDLGEVEPLVDGRFFADAVRTSSTPAGFSTGALDVTAAEAWVLANQEDLDGKLDNLTAFTTTVWVNLQGDPANNDRMFRAGSGTGFGFRMADPTSGSISASNFQLTLDFGAGGLASGADFDAADKWLFLAVTYDREAENAHAKFFEGGENRAAALRIAHDLPDRSTGVLDAVLSLGRHPTAATRTMNGYLDDFRVYRGALSLEEIEAIRFENVGDGTPGTGFASWVTEHFDAAEQADPNISGAEADPDGDGISNLLEYALGGNPKTPSRGILPASGIDADSGYLTLTFIRPDGVSGIDFTVESSSRLPKWNADAVLVESTAVSGGTRETYRAPHPMDGQETGFLRLRIEQK